MMVNRAAIKLRRESMGLTMEQAAIRAGFGGRQRWYAIESGERASPSVDTLYAVARALQCSMDELMLPPKTKPPRVK